MAKRKKKKPNLALVKKQKVPDLTPLVEAATEANKAMSDLGVVMSQFAEIMKNRMREQYSGIRDRIPVFFETSNDPFSERGSMSVQEYINREIRNGMIVSPDRNFDYERELQSERRMYRQGMDIGRRESDDYSREMQRGDMTCPICGMYGCPWWKRYKFEFAGRSREDIQSKHETIDLKEGVDYIIEKPKQISNG
jgi:hypothetical protein